MILYGLDLAWRPDRNSSALAIWDQAALRAELFPALDSSAAIHAVIARDLGQASLLAVDAPLVVRNLRGQRPCEAQLNADFRRHHAGAHPSNLSLYPDAETVRLAEQWRSLGFADFPPEGVRNRQDQRWMAEVYPHPAQVTLLGRERILRYKRGTVTERREQLTEFQRILGNYLSKELPQFLAAAPIHDLFALAPAELRGRRLKIHEDALDACFCVAIAARLAAAGPQSFHFYGDHDSGFIVVPKA